MKCSNGQTVAFLLVITQVARLWALMGSHLLMVTHNIDTEVGAGHAGQMLGRRAYEVLFPLSLRTGPIL